MTQKDVTNQLWMVRAGRGADYIDDFVKDGFVGIGFDGAGEVDKSTTKVEIVNRLAAENPNSRPSANSIRASQVVRFFNGIEVGDWVITYDPNQRLYFLGTVKSEVCNRDHTLRRSRNIQWSLKVQRDLLQVATKNTLGAISTLFLIKGEATEDIMAHAIGIADEPIAPNSVKSENLVVEESEQLEGILARAGDYIEDAISSLDWSEMQELVSEILKAMGYRTRVSQAGPDQGVDIFASPDGLGLNEPRIFVEVKHRSVKMGSQDIRAFLGGRQPGDRCLYVSTGGFSKEAKYEAGRSPIPISLITLPRLRELLVEYYESMSPVGKALIPLRLVYWPV